MAGPTLNDLPLLVATISEPLVGRWTAQVEVDSGVDITDPVTLSFEGGLVSLVGSIYRGGLESGRWLGTIVSGTGGLTTTLDPKAYRLCPLGLILSDLMLATDETLSSTSETLETWTVPLWQRIEGNALSVMHRLADETGYTWRVLRDGTVWIGEDDFDELDPEADTVKAFPDLGMTVVAPRGAPLGRPATTIDGVAIHDVVTRLDGGSIRQELWSAATA
jgi:hypothetical protein